MPSYLRPRLPFVAMIAIATLLLLGCGGDSGDSADSAAGDEGSASSTTTSAPTTTLSTTTLSTTTLSTTTSSSSSTTAPTTTTEAAPVVVEVNESSFVNINDMTPVRGFFVDNLLGDLDATLAVANNLEGGVYPPGSVVQLVPGEAMVKREAGFSPETGDWEFFELMPSAEGTVIRVRGGAEAVNQFGGSCADCHSFAEPQFDFICEQTHGCEPLPIGPDVFALLQSTDPRPRLDAS